MLRVFEEVEAHQALLVVQVFLGAIGQNHVVHALERRARHGRILADDAKVFFEGALPRQLGEDLLVLQRGDGLNEGGGGGSAHPVSLSAGRRLQTRGGMALLYHARARNAGQSRRNNHPGNGRLPA